MIFSKFTQRFVVEFEKRFKDTFSVVQFNQNDFSRKWPKSGAASLGAWVELLTGMGYTLCAIWTCGFNAFFIRSDIYNSMFLKLSTTDAFENHPILSKKRDKFLMAPDQTWRHV